MHSLNLGILAHVDAGKTSLTERLLFDCGVTDRIGRVDDGSTQTDTLALERERGITIRAAVVSFLLGDLCVNLIDTPGHPDFIAEVERTLGVLDGAVLVISAVEGVQAQTRVLMRALARLGIPAVIFVNKIDRSGADCDRVLRDISARLTPAIVAMGAAGQPGSRDARWRAFGASDGDFRDRLADLLTAHDDALLAAYVDQGPGVPYRRLRAALADQARRAIVHPVYLGSAVTGAGVGALMAGLTEFLPPAGGQPHGPPDGRVFKVERGPAGEKVAHVRMFSGTLTAREPVHYGTDGTGKVTALSVFGGAGAQPGLTVAAGQIGRLRGLAGIRVGDRIGARPAAADRYFAPPTLETVVVPARPSRKAALYSALAELAEQDPLINLRQDDRGELMLSLYGEVQKEVIQAMLSADFGVEAIFRETTTICAERLTGTGEAAEAMGDPGNPFKATVGLRIAPGPPDSGVQFRAAIELGSLPPAFLRAVEETGTATLRQGLHGWPVLDCAVTLTRSGYVPPPPTGWSMYSSSASDFRNLTPLVVMAALRRAGTAVCEPVSSFWLEVPAASLPPVMTALARLRACGQTPSRYGSSCVIEGEIPSGRVHDLQQQLPALTGGEGVLESGFARYQPVSGAPPARPRTDRNPLSRREYLLHVQRVTAQ